MELSELLHIVARWTHVIFGVMWIGQTYLFNWFEKHLPDELAESAKPNVSGQLWMVHGGGFYFLEKQTQPENMPRTLHWFKYESLVTWISGIMLLILVYYLGGALTDDMVSDIKNGEAIALSAALLIGGWVVYDLLLMFTPLEKNDTATGAVFFVMLVGLIYFLTHTLAGRAAYMQVGAMFGTVMVANVWMRILPGQRRMIRARQQGKEPDLGYGARGKQRSKHNSFMSVPLIFIMISSHFPVSTYGHQYNWVILSVIILVGWVAAKLIREH